MLAMQFKLLLTWVLRLRADVQSEDASPEIYIDMNLLRRDETRAEEKITNSK